MAQLNDLLVTGNSRFLSTVHCDIDGNSETSTLASKLSTEQGTSAGARPVWYSYLGDNTRAVYNKNFTYNPSGGVLSATKFVGALQGNADTATSASKLGSSNVGSTTQPIYLNGGTATACTYTLGKSVPSNAVFTDEKAKQENVTTNSEYRVLLSGSATNSTETSTTKKSSKLKFKASSSELKVGDTESYGTTYHCELSPSEIGLYRKETQQSSSSTYIGLRMWRDSSTGEYDIQNSSTWDGTNDSLREAINSATSIWNIVYPVGCYFETTDTTFDPNTAWGGTWVLEDEGLVHISSGTNYNVSTNNQDGGNSTINYTPAGSNSGGSVQGHTLTANESGVQGHTHGAGTTGEKLLGTNAAGGTGVSRRTVASGSGAANVLYADYAVNRQTSTSSTSKNAVNAHSHGFTNPTFSGTQATLNVMQPYKIVNRWHRTA